MSTKSMEPPANIVLLMTDQHRVDTIGCYGGAACETPALDALASAGTRFDAAFTPTAICGPARASLVTGVLPFRHGLVANAELGAGQARELGDMYPSFAWALRDVGYRVHHVGKWHVGAKRGPEAFGFEGVHYDGWENPVEHPTYLAWLAERGLPPFRLSDEVRLPAHDGKPGRLLAGIVEQPTEATFDAFLADQAIDQLRDLAETWHTSRQPFYLGVHWFGPHLPYCIPREWFERFDTGSVELPGSIAETFAGKPRVQKSYSEYWGFDSLSLDTWRRLIAAYHGYVAMIDAQIQRIVDAVKCLGLWDSTALLFTADHGEFTGSHRLHSKGPAMYDDIYRIPLIARLPGAPAHRIESRLASLLDVPPTVLDLAGVPIPEHMDGCSLVPLIRGDDRTSWRDTILAEFHGLHFPYPQRMLRTDRYKLVVNPGDVNELYDLAVDPDELHNRYDHPELAEIRNHMYGRLQEELERRGDPLHHWMAAMEGAGR